MVYFYIPFNGDTMINICTLEFIWLLRKGDKVHLALTIMKQQASIIKVSTECNKQKGRKTDDE